MMSDAARLSPIDAANMLAGHAVAYASAFLDGRHDARQLASNADSIFTSALSFNDNVETNLILHPVRLLATAMRGTALSALDPTQTETRNERWQKAMASLVELVCNYSLQLRKD